MENIWNSEEMITNREYLQRRMTEIQRQEEALVKDRSVPHVLLPPQDRVEDLAHSQNIPKAKQKSGGFMSYLFGDPDRKLQEENDILSQQLEECKQEIILTRRKADRDIQQAYSRIEETERTLQEFIERYQQEIQRSNTRLQETRSQLQESDTRLQETQSQLQETQSQLQDSDTRLQDTQVQLQLTQHNSQQQIQVIMCNYNPSYNYVYIYKYVFILVKFESNKTLRCN